MRLRSKKQISSLLISQFMRSSHPKPPPMLLEFVLFYCPEPERRIRLVGWEVHIDNKWISLSHLSTVHIRHGAPCLVLPCLNDSVLLSAAVAAAGRAVVASARAATVAGLEAGADAAGTAAAFAAYFFATQAYLQGFCHSCFQALAGHLLPCMHTCWSFVQEKSIRSLPLHV